MRATSLTNPPGLVVQEACKAQSTSANTQGTAQSRCIRHTHRNISALRPHQQPHLSTPHQTGHGGLQYSNTAPITVRPEGGCCFLYQTGLPSTGWSDHHCPLRINNTGGPCLHEQCQLKLFFLPALTRCTSQFSKVLKQSTSRGGRKKGK